METAQPLRHRQWPRPSLRSASLLAMLMTGPAMAQGDLIKEDPGVTPTKKKAEKIRITGSRIKRTDIEGVSPVLTIDRDEIDRSGVSTVSELLQNLSISSQGSYASSTVNDTRGTVTNVNLRGLGSNNTLVLLDGRRLPDEGGGGTVDLSSIPMAAVERIEVLKDSASAIYGSDATGGVVNIITRKDLNGSVFAMRAAQPAKLDGNQETDFSYLTGVNKSGFRSITMLNYKHSEATFYKDRDWTKDGISMYAYPANYIYLADGFKITAHDNCNSPERITEDDNPNSLCAYKYGDTSAFTPEVTQIGFMNNIEYDINNKVSLYSSIRAVKNTNLWNMAPNAGSFSIPQEVAQANLARLGLKEDEIPGDVQLFYRAIPWGVRTWEEEKTTIGANLGLKGEINMDWEWNFSVGRAESKKNSVNPQGFMTKDTLRTAISSGDFNPFETELSERSLKVVDDAAYEPFTITKTDSSTYNFDVTGELFNLPSGPVGAAVGVQRVEQGYNKSIDPQSEADNVFGVTEDKGSEGDREINAAYVEFAVPVADNAEIQLAARYDNYSDFGDTTNPKFAFKYLPHERVLIRGSAGTGFKAPTLEEVHKGTQVSLLNLNDTIKCGGPCATGNTNEVEIESIGNLDLQEERSRGYTFGVITEPVDGLSLGIDYWYIKISDIVADMDAQDVLDNMAEGRSYDGVEVSRIGGPDGRLERIVVPTMNLGEREDSGVDVSLGYQFRVSTSRVSLKTDYSRKFYAKSVRFPGQPQEDTLGERGEPRWRATNTAGLTYWRAHNVMVRNNSIGKHESDKDREQVISSFSTYDAQYTWAHPWNGTFAFGALNVFDKKFPRDPTQRAGDDVRAQELYNPHGLTYFVKLEQTL